MLLIAIDLNAIEFDCNCVWLQLSLIAIVMIADERAPVIDIDFKNFYP